MSDLTITVTGEGNGNFKKREFFVDPKPGMFQAVCVDVIDLGFSKNSFNKVTRKIQFAFQLANTITEAMVLKAKAAKGLPAEIDEDDKELIGKRLFIRSKKMNFSLYPGGENMSPSDLYKFLEDWNGERFPKPTKDNPLTINFEGYVGKNALLMVVTNKDRNDPSITYSNVNAIMPLEDETPLELDDTYTRVKDREHFKAPPTEADVTGGVSTASTNGQAAADVEIPWDKAA
jgi:hypothetical protein